MAAYQCEVILETTLNCNAFFGLIKPEADCAELHGYEVTMDNRVVMPELRGNEQQKTTE
jgi:hypothetical protein